MTSAGYTSTNNTWYLINQTQHSISGNISLISLLFHLIYRNANNTLSAEPVHKIYSQKLLKAMQFTSALCASTDMDGLFESGERVSHLYKIDNPPQKKRISDNYSSHHTIGKHSYCDCYIHHKHMIITNRPK